MNLQPGFYKVKDMSGSIPSFHLLRVFEQQGKRMYQFDHGLPEEEGKLENKDNLTVVKRINRTFSIKSVKVLFKITDEDDDAFEMQVRDGYGINRIWEVIPHLKEFFKIKK